jgi:uncharacterized damage-inducible protein DinB
MGEIRTLLTVPEGYRSATVARFLWQMDEQRAGLLADVRGLSPAALGWQPRPGMNTIGMLLAHIAYAEAHLGQVGLLGEAVGHAEDVIGLTEEEEGLPLAPGAPPSPALEGRTLADFEGLLSRAREHTRTIARTMTDADLEREVVRRRPDGTLRVFNVGWVFYHLLEHEAGHRGQIGVLKHLQRLAPGD